MSTPFKELRIEKVHEEIKGFKTFVFEEGHGVQYQPGQYLTLVHKSGDEEIRRSYSITSAPALQEPLIIGVKRIANGFFSRQLIDHAQEGDILLTTGAGGFFVLPENINAFRQVYFFAAGSGITPIFSLIKTILYSFPHTEVILAYSNHSVDETIFYKEFLDLQNEFANRFHIQFFFGTSFFLNGARLNKEGVVSLVRKYVGYSLDKALFYICGPEAYMRMCSYALQEEKIPAENIKKENFIVDKIKPIQIAPPDREAHKVVIYYGSDQFELDVQYPFSILQTAKRKGIVLPYSCETGRCGNCVAQCVKGKVWLSYNEVLTENDLKKGLVLTCVGYPVEGDVVLEIK